jgi:hypothetical protein
LKAQTFICPVEALSLEAGKVWLYYSTSTHAFNYIQWNSAHSLYPSHLFLDKSLVLTPESLRGRSLTRIFNKWVLEDDEREELETIRSTQEWIVRFSEPEPALFYNWETEVGIVAKSPHCI